MKGSRYSQRVLECLLFFFFALDGSAAPTKIFTSNPKIVVPIPNGTSISIQLIRSTYFDTINIFSENVTKCLTENHK